MPDLAHWSVFLTATIIVLVIPGPSVLFVVARGIDQGFRAALLSSVGLAFGDLVFSSLTTLEGGPSPRLRSGQALGVKLAFAFSASPQGWDSRMPRFPFLNPEPVNSKIVTNPRV